MKKLKLREFISYAERKSNLWPVFLNTVKKKKRSCDNSDGITVVVQSFHHFQLFVTPWTAACQASLSFTISWDLLKLMSLESVMPPRFSNVACVTIACD